MCSGCDSSIVRIDYVDPGVNDEYGPFGKVVASSDVRGLPPVAISEEIAAMTEILGSHVVAVEVEEVPAAR